MQWHLQQIAYVVPDRFLAGEEVMVQIVGKFTDWSESAEVVIDYPGVEVIGTQVLVLSRWGSPFEWLRMWSQGLRISPSAS